MKVADFEQQGTLTGRQLYIVVVSAAAQLIDFLDFFLISFVITYISKPWHLGIEETTIILLSSGAGAVIGSFVCGNLSDRFGRRAIFLAALALFAVATTSLVLIPEGAWQAMAFFRFFVGCGATAIYVTNIPLLQDFMPTRRRGFISGIVVTFIPVGILLGSALVALFGDAIGWRGLLAMGALPALPLIVGAAVIPESPLWLAMRGRDEASRRSVAWAPPPPPAQVMKPADYVKTAGTRAS